MTRPVRKTGIIEHIARVMFGGSRMERLAATVLIAGMLFAAAWWLMKWWGWV